MPRRRPRIPKPIADTRAVAARRSPSPEARRAPAAPGNQAQLRLSTASLDPRAVARSGFEGGSPLPFAQQLGGVFGGYAIKGIRAHTGEGARVASRTLGASAYAMGEDIGFRGTPTLSKTAHEVTHVLAQRAGHAPSGAMGRVGDKYEKLADSVAEHAKRGASAEGVLDKALGGRGRRPGPAPAAPPVQCDIGPAAEVGDAVTDGYQRYTITAVADGPSGTKLYTVESPETFPREISSDAAMWALATAPRPAAAATSAAASGGASKGKSRYSKLKRMTTGLSSRWAAAKSAFEDATSTGARSYGALTTTEAREDDVDLDDAAADLGRFRSTMGVEHTDTGSGALSRAGTIIDTVASASKFGVDRAIDRTVESGMSLQEQVRSTLPMSTARKVEAKLGQFFQACGGLVQTVIPVVGGTLASPVTGLGDSLESHAGGLSKKRAVAHGALTGGSDAAVGAIPGYGNYVGFVGMCSDVKRLFSASKGPSKMETLHALTAQRRQLRALGKELRDLGFNPRKRLPGYAEAVKTLDHYIEKYRAELKAQQASGKAGLLKHAATDLGSDDPFAGFDDDFDF